MNYASPKAGLHHESGATRAAHNERITTMISNILNDFAAGSSNIAVGSTAVDGVSDFFAGILSQVAQFVSAAFGS